jgi:hypothetical protein
MPDDIIDEKGINPAKNITARYIICSDDVCIKAEKPPFCRKTELSSGMLSVDNSPEDVEKTSPKIYPKISAYTDRSHSKTRISFLYIIITTAI